MPRAVVAFALLLALVPVAHQVAADEPADLEALCHNKTVGSPCQVGSRAGNCAATRCCSLDYARRVAGRPPLQVCRDCTTCVTSSRPLVPLVIPDAATPAVPQAAEPTAAALSGALTSTNLAPEVSATTDAAPPVGTKADAPPWWPWAALAALSASFALRFWRRQRE
jgi:hypothetical protein